MADFLGDSTCWVRERAVGLGQIDVNVEMAGTMVMSEKVNVTPMPMIGLRKPLEEGFLSHKKTRDFFRNIFRCSKVAEEEMRLVERWAVLPGEGYGRFNRREPLAIQGLIIETGFMGAPAPNLRMSSLLFRHLIQRLLHEAQSLNRRGSAVARDERSHREKGVGSHDRLKVANEGPKPTQQGSDRVGITIASPLDEGKFHDVPNGVMAERGCLAERGIQEHCRVELKRKGRHLASF